MLKRTRETVRAVAESTGLLNPSLADAQAAADEHRRTLVEAQTAREAAEQALQAGHDGAADDAAINRLEAALAAAKTAEQRAERGYLGAEKRLAAASAAEADKLKTAARVRRDAAAGALTKAAGELDRLAVLMAAQAQAIDAQYSAFNEARRDGVAGPFVPTSGAATATLALERAIAAQAGEWTGNRPSATDAAERVTGAILSNAHG